MERCKVRTFGIIGIGGRATLRHATVAIASLWKASGKPFDEDAATARSQTKITNARSLTGWNKSGSVTGFIKQQIIVMEFNVGMKSNMYVIRLKSTGMIRIDCLHWRRCDSVNAFLISWDNEFTWAEYRKNGWECVPVKVAHSRAGSIWISVVDKTVKDLQ